MQRLNGSNHSLTSEAGKARKWTIVFSYFSSPAEVIMV